MLNKNYILSLILSTLFLMNIGTVFFLYIQWNDDVEEAETNLEVNLPIINWEKYLGLSKQRE